MSLILSRFGLTITVSALAISTSALAQTPGDAAQVTASMLDEIVVTAQRRSQNLQEVPIAVTAVTAEALTESGVATTESLPALVPGLVMTRQARGSQPYIRGVGSQNTVPGNENAVAVYVDGVYYSDPGGSLFSFNNIQRIEVLKGPQGTLFGRNATGGLISVITRDPTVEPQLETSLNYGNYDTFEGALYASGGRGDVAADIALYAINQGEGFGRYLYLPGNPDANRREEYAVRSKIVWDLSQDDKLTVGIDYRTNLGDAGLSRNVYPGSVLTGGLAFAGSIQDSSGGLKTDLIDSSDWGVSANYKHQFENMQFSFLSAFRNNFVHFIYDQDSNPIPLSSINQQQDNRTFQNELLLSGQSGKLQWTTGAFIFHARSRFTPIQLRSLVPAGNSDLFTTQQTASYAVFAQGSYEILPDTNLTAGVRYTIDERDFYGRRIAADPNPAAPPGTVIQTGIGQRTFEEPTWRLGIDHKLAEHTLIYATYNRGFKSGVFNLVNPIAPPVDPEQLDAYEIGVKADLFDRTVRINASAFRYNYRDIQLNSVLAGITSLFNAAEGEVTGGELETTFVPRLSFGHLELTANLALLDATYTEFPSGPITTPNPAGGNIGSFGDLSGNHMIRSPKWTASLGVQYNFPTSFGEAGVTANYYHNDGFFWEADNRVAQNAYDVLNGTVFVAFGPDAQYRIRIYGANLTDEEYFSGVAENSFGDAHSAAPPRTFGIGFDYRY